MYQKCLKSHCLNQKIFHKKDSDLKTKEKQKNELLPNRFGNSFRGKIQYVPTMFQNSQKCYFLNQKKVKQKDSEFKNFSLVGKTACKNAKEKSKLLLKCFFNLFRKDPPLSAINVPKLPEMSMFDPRNKSKKSIEISEFALQ